MNIIPKPYDLVKKKGNFRFQGKTKIFLESEEIPLKLLDLLSTELHRLTEHLLQQSNSKEKADIALDLQEVGLGREGYRLVITEQQISISAGTPAGIFYGIQTLLQLLFQYKSKLDEKILLPCCQIKDQPSFSWRGMHLDVSRHFFPISFIKKYLDLLALHKMNKFHWHLTDDNGWRIEIKQFPLLTKIGAWRRDLEHLPWNEREASEEPGKGIYGGFYSQEQIREIVKYANDRYIEVIPEIEMPGHSSEVFAAYPQFSCHEKRLRVAPGGYWPNKDIFCAGKDETFEFLNAILKEVAQLFPSQYLHIGGDEANKSYWKNCPRCQQRIQQLGLKDENELQSYFIARIGKYLNSIGKKLIGWDEIMEGDLQTDALVMCWRGDGIDAALKAAEKEYKMIMCPNQVLYFDWKMNEADAGAFGVTTLEQVYNYDPLPTNLPDPSAGLILGAQGNVWSEWMETTEKVEYLALPRLSALAEVVWSGTGQKDFSNFLSRLDKFLNLITSKGFQFNSSFKKN